MPVWRTLDPATPLELKAGPASVTVVDGTVRWIRAGGTETVRGVYGAVRDPSWGTIEPVFTVYEGAIDDEAFEIRLRAECIREADGVDLVWSGMIAGTPEGTIRFVFDGTVRSPFLTARIGLCVLHPPRLAGRAVEVQTLFGRLRGRFPDLITGYMPFSNIVGIRHDAGRKCETRIDLAGDVFEMEDQRAFMDASFKTFSRPLALPQPYKVDARTSIRQEVTVSHPRVAAAGRRAARRSSHEESEVVRVGGTAGRFPTVGTVAAPSDCLADRRVTRAVRELRLAHLRATVVVADGEALPALELALKAAADAGTGLELVLVIPPDAPELETLVGRLAEGGVDIVRITPVDPARHTTSEALAARLREAMGSARLTTQLVGGSRGYLYQLISEGIPVQLVDVASYPTNPQVHASDEATLVENLEALPATVRTAMALAGGKPVAVGPISLKALFDPDRIGPELPPPPGGLPARYDRRQVTPFAAAWTLGSAAALASAGAVALTLHEAAGWAGLVAAAQRGLPAMPAEPGTVLAVGRVVEALASLATDELMHVETPPSIYAVAVRDRSGRLRVLVANLDRGSRRVTFRDRGREAAVTSAAMLVDDGAGGAAWMAAEPAAGGLELPAAGLADIYVRPDRHEA